MIDLRKAARFLAITLQTMGADPDRIKITSTEDGKWVQVREGSIRLPGHDDSLLVIFECSKDGTLIFTVVFDKLATSSFNMHILNQFNLSQKYFIGAIDDNNYLRLQRYEDRSDFDDIEDAANLCVAMLQVVAEDNDALKSLTQITE